MAPVALIPARGGSKRLPRKNILDLAGKPMLAYPIAAARASGLFARILVSTEDQEIARIAEAHGASVIARPENIAGDRATVVDVCVHALEQHQDIDILCCIYATSVLLRPTSLAGGYRLMQDDEVADFVMGVSEYEHPPVQALKADERGYLSYMWPEWRGKQSQFHPRLVVSNGTFYWARREALLSERTFYGHRMRGYLVPAAEVSDLDTPDDFIRLQARMTDLKE